MNTIADVTEDSELAYYHKPDGTVLTIPKFSGWKWRTICCKALDQAERNSSPDRSARVHEWFHRRYLDQ